MIAGFIAGQLAEPSPLRIAILPLTFLMVYPMMVTMNLRQLLQPGGGKLLWVTQLLNFILIPALGYGAGLLFFPDEPFARLALLLTSLLPTSGMTISWTGFAKGNVPAAVRMTVVGLIAGSLLAYLVPLLLIYILNFVISTLVGKALFPRGDAIALVYGTVMRTLSIALAIAMGGFGEDGADAALLIALAYIVQVPFNLVLR